MKRPTRFAFLVLLASGGLACGSDDTATSDPPQPILAMNGTISAAGRSVVPTYGAALLRTSGTVMILMSDAPMGCATLTASYTSSSMPPAGTYLAVSIPSLDTGVAAQNFLDFTVVPEHGYDLGGGGSNTGTVEVLEVSPTAIAIRVTYHDELKDGTYDVSGDFSVTRCP